MDLSSAALGHPWPPRQTNILLAIEHAFSGSHPVSIHKQKTPTLSREGCLFGGAKRDRTADLNTASVALSQLSYSPKMGS